MPTEFLEKLLAATAVPVTSQAGLDHHPDSLTGEHRDEKTGAPLESDAEMMTAENGNLAARTIFSAGRQALAMSYQTKSDIAAAVKASTELIPPHVANGRRVAGSIVENGETVYTRIKESAIIPLRESATSRFSSCAKRIDLCTGQIQDGLAALDKTINKSIEEKPTTPDDVAVASEIRAHVAHIDPKGNARVAFVVAAIQEGDRAVISAVLGRSQAFLSGLNRGEYTALREMAEKKLNPREFRQRQIGQRILTTVDSAGSQLLGNMATLLQKTARIPVNTTSDALAKLKTG
jgi:hypothetical protein